jgi:hypothetical protein
MKPATPVAPDNIAAILRKSRLVVAMVVRSTT